MVEASKKRFQGYSMKDLLDSELNKAMNQITNLQLHPKNKKQKKGRQTQTLYDLCVSQRGPCTFNLCVLVKYIIQKRL